MFLKYLLWCGSLHNQQANKTDEGKTNRTNFLYHVNHIDTDIKIKIQEKVIQNNDIKCLIKSALAIILKK